MNHEPTYGMQYFAKTPKGIEMALTLPLPEYTDATELARWYASVDAAFAKVGFTRSDRLDKPSYQGGGRGNNPRPQLPNPAGVVVPEHCGKPMKYVRYKKDGAKGEPKRNVDPGYADMWVCSLDKQCEDVTSGKSERAAANFHMHPVGKSDDQPLQRQSDKPMTYGGFLTAALAHGYNKLGVLELAQTDEEHLKAMSEADWRALIDRMEKVTA